MQESYTSLVRVEIKGMEWKNKRYLFEVRSLYIWGARMDKKTPGSTFLIL